MEIMKMFPDDGTAEAWFAKNRWPDGPRRPSVSTTLNLRV